MLNKGDAVKLSMAWLFSAAGKNTLPKGKKDFYLRCALESNTCLT